MSTSGPAHRVQSAVVEYGFPQGHLGHLTPHEEATLKEFKTLCEEKGLFKSEDSSDGLASHDDATLLRFLRARRFHVEEAFKQFKDTEDWRNANQIPQLYETIDLQQYDDTRRLYPQWTGRRDRRGIPVYIFEVKHLNSKTMAAYEKSAASTSTKAKTDGKTSAKLLRLFALYENLTCFVMPLCTALADRDYPKTPITQSNNIVDISGVGLKQFWNLRGHMQDASTLATAHYPETLDRIFIIGAPSFFPTVWSWIKKWFDPITTSKIFILSSHDMQSTLQSFIDPVNIPKKYGGELDFEFGDMPTLDPALKEVISWDEGKSDFPHGPIHWKDVDGGKSIQAVAVGSVDGKERKEDVCKVKKMALVEKTEPSTDVKASEHATRPEFFSMPTATESITQAEGHIATFSATTPSAPAAEAGKELESGSKAVQDGELVPTSRPEPVSFVTASEGLQTLSLNEKKDGSVPNGVAVTSTQTNAIQTSANKPECESTEQSEGRKLTESNSKIHALKDKVMEKVHH